MRHYSRLKIKVNTVVKTGSLLLAQPFQNEGIYKHSAILIVDQGIDGTSGIIINKMSNLLVSDALPDLTLNKPLFCGGPIDVPVISFLHIHADVPGTVHMKDNLYWGGNYEFMRDLLEKGQCSEDEIKFFAGFVTWNQGELDYEIQQGRWWVSDIEPDKLFITEPDKMWSQFLKSNGHAYGLFEEIPEPSIN